MEPTVKPVGLRPFPYDPSLKVSLRAKRGIDDGVIGERSSPTYV